MEQSTFDLLRAWVVESESRIVVAALILSAVATVLGAVTSASKAFIQDATFEFIRATVGRTKPSLQLQEGESTPDLVKSARLDDLINIQKRFKSSARISGFSYNSLIFGQYIIGALLASSFIQQTFSPNLIGVLGVLVLLSSAIQQRFRPDVIAAHAKMQTVKANRLIRRIEDELFLVTNNAGNAQSIFAIREAASRGLSELEDAELLGIEEYFDKREFPSSGASDANQVSEDE